MTKDIRIICILFLLIIPTIFTFSNRHHAPESMYMSYNGLVMAGYQGWFKVNKDSVIYPDEKNIRIDMWPDVSEYKKTYPTGLKLADGSTARFFNSADASTVDLHFKWMKEYGVDGVFMQRFFNMTRATSARNTTTAVLKPAFAAAAKYHRAIAVMYDLSGLKGSGEDCSSIIEDWKYLVDSLKVTNMSGGNTYLYHNGKPLVAIWGVGFPDRPYNIRNIGLTRLLDFLKNDPVYGGLCEIIIKGMKTNLSEVKF